MEFTDAEYLDSLEFFLLVLGWIAYDNVSLSMDLPSRGAGGTWALFAHRLSQQLIARRLSQQLASKAPAQVHRLTLWGWPAENIAMYCQYIFTACGIRHLVYREDFY